MAWASSAERGLDTTEFMRRVAFWATVTAIVLLLVVELFLRRRVGRGVYHWLLLAGLFVLPLFSLTATAPVVLEQSKTVASCASCHAMDPFVKDLRDPTSTTLAARHYRNKWIPRDQCYECHTTYGLHGTLQAKAEGLRHWWKYVTGQWHRPIQFLGKYPDANCLTCHGGTPGFENSQPHQEAFKALEAGEVNCLFCHGPPHPTAQQRKPASPDQPETARGAKTESKTAPTPEKSDSTKGNKP